MISATAALVGSYDYSEVARSILIAIAASYVALDLAGRLAAAKGWVGLAWLSGGATAMGIGIWAMHVKGMLAFRLPVPVEYHLPTFLASLLVAILASAVALYVSSRRKMGLVTALTASAIMSAGISGMHYTGMAAMRMPAIARFSSLLVAISILFAFIFSLVALLMAFDLREETRWTVPRRVGSAVVMGFAVSAMHYTGMAAASFTPASPPDLSHAVSISPLANNGIAIVTLIVLVAAMVTSSVDRRASMDAERLNQELERRVAERTRQLEAAIQALKNEIVERRRAEEALRESEDHLRRVIDTIPQQIWSGPPDGSLDFCNAQFRSNVGLTQEELRGDGWQHILHPADRERVVKDWRESVVNGTPFEHGVRHRMADGQYRWFLVRGVPLKDSAGRVVRWYGTNTDIEDRKQAADRLRLVIDTTPAMLHSAGPDGNVDFFNKRWLEYVGVPLDNLLGWRWTNVFHPDDVAGLIDKLRTSLATGKAFEAEARLRRADGEYRLTLLRKVPLRDEAGSIVKWYGSAIDIEDRKRAEQQLRQAQLDLAHITRVAAMGELVVSIAHEVNQPLTGIITTSNLVLRQMEGERLNLQALREPITEIAEDAARIRDVISRVRALVKKDAVDQAELNINHVIREAALLVSHEAARNDVQVRLDLAINLPVVLGDRVQLQQVLINLAMNGIDAIMHTIVGRPRELVIRSAKHANGVLVQVQDSGIGLDRIESTVFLNHSSPPNRRA